MRVYYGVENVLLCDAVVEKCGEGQNGFNTGPSARHERIERM